MRLHRLTSTAVLARGVFLFGTLLAVSRTPAAAQTPLTLGTTIDGEIAAAGDLQLYTVTALPGDVLTLHASRRSGDLWPKVALLTSGGQTLAESAQPVTTDLTVTAPASGTYTVRISDGFNGTYTGHYGLFVQRLNDPMGASPLTAGLTVEGSVFAPGEIHTRTITAQRGDTLVARMSNRDGRLWPGIRLYDPAGNLLLDAHEPTSVDMTRTVSSNGTYTLLLGDGFDGTLTGSYGLFIQRANRPENATPLVEGRYTTDSLEGPGVMKTYTVSLPIGFTSPLSLRMRRTGGNLWPLLRVYNPDGTLAGEEHGISSTTVSTSAPAGTYTVIAGDGFNGTYAGFFVVGWTFAISDAAGAMRIAAGSTTPSSIQRDLYNVVTLGASADVVDMADAVWIMRNAAGL